MASFFKKLGYISQQQQVDVVPSKNLPYLIFTFSFSFVDPYLMGALKVLILVEALDQGDETFLP